MINRFEVEFKNNVAGYHPTAKKISITNTETENYAFPISLMVKNCISNEYIYNLQFNCELPGSFFKDAIVIKDQVITAIENHIYFFNTQTNEIKQYRLNGYFDKFHIYNDSILVTTNTHISLFSESGSQVWVSDKIAVEKIIIKEISDIIVNGTASLEEGKGLIEFSISFSTGKSPKVSPKKKRISMFSSLFA